MAIDGMKIFEKLIEEGVDLSTICKAVKKLKVEYGSVKIDEGNINLLEPTTICDGGTRCPALKYDEQRGRDKIDSYIKIICELSKNEGKAYYNISPHGLTEKGIPL